MNASDLASIQWTDHLRQHVPIARTGVDPEGIHQLRVALQHLRVWLVMHQKRPLARSVKDARSRLGRPRDLDVLLLRNPPSAFAGWLRLQRSTVDMDQALAPLLPLADEIQTLPALPRPRAWAMTRRWASDCVERAFLLDPANDETFHSLRRRLRRVRYGLEWLGEDPSMVKSLQGVFGAMNDAAVTRSFLDEWGGAVPEWRRRLDSELVEHRRRCRESWDASRELFIELSAGAGQ
ncbi:MAG: CHAD domain-containing protein [Myxococcota bacterium]|jgi:CHAD domain-containing protein